MKTSTNERFISQTSIIDIRSPNARANDPLTSFPLPSFDVGCSAFDVRCSPVGFRVPRSAFCSPKCQPIPADSTGVRPRARVTVVRQSCTHSAVVPTQTVVLRMRSCLVVPNRMGGEERLPRSSSQVSHPQKSDYRVARRPGSAHSSAFYQCPKLNCPPPLFPALFAPLCSR
jgi:hypothetical protein